MPEKVYTYYIRITILYGYYVTIPILGRKIRSQHNVGYFI